MKRSIAALALTTSLVFATSAFAQTLDKVVKVGSLGDQSGLYADIGGPGSTLQPTVGLAEDPRAAVRPAFDRKTLVAGFELTTQIERENVPSARVHIN